MNPEDMKVNVKKYLEELKVNTYTNKMHRLFW